MFSPRPVGGNYDPCANLSAILMTVDPPLSIPPPVQAMLFHRGTYMGKATMKSHPGPRRC
ncbi:MAG: LppP/LprE family lipoprotein [Mycobacterium sp.]